MQYLPTGRSSPSSGDSPQHVSRQASAGLANDGSRIVDDPHLGAELLTPFSRFYDAEYEGQVRRAYLLLGSAASAHDIVADAFVQVLQRWESIEEPGPYLNRCVLNGCRDAAKRTKREALFSGERLRPSSRSPHPASDRVQDADGDSGNKARNDITSAPLDETGSFGSSGSFSSSEEIESGLDLAIALLQLPFRQRAAVVLRFYTGATESEIAESLGCRPGTVGSLIHRGLASLRKGLTP